MWHRNLEVLFYANSLHFFFGLGWPAFDLGLHLFTIAGLYFWNVVKSCTIISTNSKYHEKRIIWYSFRKEGYTSILIQCYYSGSSNFLKLGFISDKVIKKFKIVRQILCLPENESNHDIKPFFPIFLMVNKLAHSSY